MSHVCPYTQPIQDWKPVLISYVWHNNRCVTWTCKKYHKVSPKYALRKCNMQKHSGCMHLTSWKYSLKHDPGHLYKIRVSLNDTSLVGFRSEGPTRNHFDVTNIDILGRRIPNWIQGSSEVKYGVEYSLTLMKVKCGQNADFYVSAECMRNLKRHQKSLLAVLSSSYSYIVSDFRG